MGRHELASHEEYGSVQLGIGVARLTDPARKRRETG
jgi:hypothetical protein